MYFISSCGGLKVNATDFTVVNGVITSGSETTDVFTPTYSAGVSATFDEVQYESKAGKESQTFNAIMDEDAISWRDAGGTLVNIPDFGFTNITGAIEGSTITVTYTQGSTPRTELVGEPFVAGMCGGIKFDDGVFDEVRANGKDVIVTVGTTSSTNYLKANCGLLFDADIFEIGDDGEIKLA